MGRLRQFMAVALLLYWVALFVGTHLPVHTFGTSDKVLHLSAYSGLAFLLAAVWLARRPSAGKLALVAMAVIAYGAFDEWSQGFVPGRTSDWWDWYSDMLGGAVGIVLYLTAWLMFERVRASVPRRPLPREERAHRLGDP